MLSRVDKGALAAFALGLSLVGTSPALAKEPSRAEVELAKDMVKEAQGEAKAGRCGDAIQILQQALAIYDSAEAFLTLGECQEQSGKLKDALASYKRGVEIAEAQKEKARAASLVSKRDELAARIPKLRLTLPSGVDNASVKLDGAAVPKDKLDAPIEVDPGEHLVEATAPSQEPFSGKVVAKEKDTTAVVIEFGTTQQNGKIVVRAAGSGPPLSTWIAAGAAVVLAGGGIGAYLAASSAADAGADECKKLVTCDPGRVGSVRSLDGAALGLWIGAGVALGAGATLWVLAPKKPTDAAARLVVGPSSVSVVGSF